MFLQIGSEWVRFVGDPHMGKKFQTGVPLHRRGEREKHQREELARQLRDTTAPDGKTVKAVICVGDLFDGFHMPNEVVFDTYNIMAAAAVEGLIRGVEYITLMGNHDVTRNLNLASSFDLLSLMAFPENVHFVRNLQSHILQDVDLPILLCPYNTFEPTSTTFSDIEDMGHSKYAVAVGHWDTVSFGNEHNLLPYAKLAPLCDVIVTGHEHNARTFTYEQTQIIVTGSMLPYSFAEDEAETIYVTRTLTQYLEDPQAYSDKCLRLLIEPGETVPENIEAMQVSFKYVNNEKVEESEVVMDEFNLKDLFTGAFKDNEVSEETTETYWGKYTDATSA